MTKTPWTPHLDFQLVQLSKNYLTFKLSLNDDLITHSLMTLCSPTWIFTFFKGTFHNSLCFSSKFLVFSQCWLKWKYVYFQVSPITSCPLIYVDGTEGQEALVLEHMKQHGWRDAVAKKKGQQPFWNFFILLPNAFTLCLFAIWPFVDHHRAECVYFSVFTPVLRGPKTRSG